MIPSQTLFDSDGKEDTGNTATRPNSREIEPQTFSVMTKDHAVNHLSSVVGVTLAIYAVWSMLLNPTQGPLPGTTLPLAVGLLLFGAGVVLFGWGSYRIYGHE